MTLTPEQISLFNSLVEKLKARASLPHAIDFQGDNFCAGDGGNYDDTFEMGCRVGEIDYARELCNFLKVPYTVDKEW
jgi:hypothetical protein